MFCQVKWLRQLKTIFEYLCKEVSEPRKKVMLQVDSHGSTFLDGGVTESGLLGIYPLGTAVRDKCLVGTKMDA